MTAIKAIILLLFVLTETSNLALMEENPDSK